jgi:adenylate cyclase
MGDGVNVAARLEDMNKRFGTTICISDSVFQAVGADIVVRPLQSVRVKGRDHEFMVYELLGIRNSEDPELQARGESENRKMRSVPEVEGSEVSDKAPRSPTS